MTEMLSISELVSRVNDWCTANGVEPLNGQAGERVTERNVRFYRTVGLVDAPVSAGQGYGERHFLQLVGVRLLQAQGLPLRRVRELLHGRSIDELREVQRRGVLESAQRTMPVFPPAAGDELWRVIPLDADFMLVSRRGAQLTPVQREAVLRALATGAANETAENTFSNNNPQT